MALSISPCNAGRWRRPRPGFFVPGKMLQLCYYCVTCLAGLSFMRTLNTSHQTLTKKGEIQMEIYLVRHAEALEQKEGLADAVRHLTRRGRKQAVKQAKRLKKRKVRPELIITSPLVRAVQTAELLATELSKDALVAAHSCLTGEADAAAVIAMLCDAGKLKSVMLVGHEPQLSRVAAQLQGYEHVAPLQKGSCMALSWKPEKQGTSAIFQWYAVSGKKLVTSAGKARTRSA